MSAEPAPASKAAIDEVLAERAQAVDDAARELRDQDAGAIRRAFALRDAVEAFHKEGLARILRVLRDHAAGDELLQALAQDPFAQAMLRMHGFIRPDLDWRIELGVNAARPLLEQHGGDVEFVKREGDVAYVRLLGACTDCTLAPLTLREAVTDAILKQAPEITRVELVPDDRAKQKPVIEHPGEGWERGPDLADLEDGVVLRFDLSETSVLIRRNADRVRAWYNRCPHQHLALDGGLHDRRPGNLLRCPWHGYTFDVDNGECVDNKTVAPLHPVPLIDREGSLWLRP